MANSNFVVHNGLTVGPTSIDAATGNVSIPQSRQILIGNVILRDRGDGKLQIRDASDNSDATLLGTFTSTSQTAGNIQIGTNHLESTNVNGEISLRPNGTGQIYLSSNTIDTGRGGDVTIGTGGSAGFAAGNIRLSPGGGKTTVVNSPFNVTGAAVFNSTVNTTGSLIVGGNLTVNGTTTTINSTTLDVDDLQITVASGAASAAAADGAGIRVDGASATLSYANTGDKWVSNKSFDVTGTLTATTLAGTLSTAAQTNITSVGTLTSLTVSGTTQPNANATVSLGGTSNYWLNIYGRNGYFDDIIVGGGSSTFASNVTVTGYVMPGANLTYDLGSGTTWWRTFYGVSTQAQYADLAENYLGDKPYAPGTVVMFGGTAEVTLADADTRAVAGVVSHNPAHLMNGGLTGPNVVPLALQGRVPCNVIGPVKKGDMMVSAGFGYAKSSANPAVGQVIGKALSDFNGSKGQIEVVVGRV